MNTKNLTPTALMVALVACACNLVDDEPMDPDPSAGSGGPASCDEVADATECPAGTVPIVIANDGTVTWVAIDDPQAGIGVGNGIILGVGAVADYILTQVIDHGTCVSGCAVINPCGTSEPADDSGGAEGEPQPANACSFNPISPLGIPQTCFYCGEVTPDECEDIILACAGIDPDHPPSDAGGGDSADGSTSDDGSVDDTGDADQSPPNFSVRASGPHKQPKHDGLGIGKDGKTYDCSRWDPLRYINRDDRGVVYADEPLLEAIVKVDGMTLSMCDLSKFSFAESGHLQLKNTRLGGVFDEMGLKNGDVILAVDGHDAREFDVIWNAVQARLDGTQTGARAFSLRVKRGLKQLVIPVYID